MTCKCGARTYEGHLWKFKDGKSAAHVYTGYIWLTEKDKEAK